MPEAFAVLFVFVVAVAAYVAARLHAANPANINPATDVQRLRQQRAWLEERLQLAWRENWDQTMLARIAEEIEAVEAEIVRATATLHERR